jgi:hypothetical protein
VRRALAWPVRERVARRTVDGLYIEKYAVSMAAGSKPPVAAPTFK